MYIFFYGSGEPKALRFLMKSLYNQAKKKNLGNNSNVTRDMSISNLINNQDNSNVTSAMSISNLLN